MIRAYIDNSTRGEPISSKLLSNSHPRLPLVGFADNVSGKPWSKHLQFMDE